MINDHDAGGRSAATSSSHCDGCCSPSSSVETALDEIRGEPASADVAAVRRAAFELLLERGAPVTTAHLTAATGIERDRVVEICDAADARGRIEFDVDGQLVGIAGLSLTPSRHRLEIGSTTRWTWCALDAVGILGALGATGTVVSSDPHTDDTIEIEFTDGVPDTSAVLFLRDGFSEGNVRASWCPQVNFFANHEAAAAWTGARGVDGDVVAVTAIAAEVAAMWLDVAGGDPSLADG